MMLYAMYCFFEQTAPVPEIAVLQLGKPILVQSVVTVNVTDNEHSVWCCLVLQMQATSCYGSDALVLSLIRFDLSQVLSALYKPHTCRCAEFAAASERTSPCRMVRLWQLRTTKAHEVRRTRSG